MLQSCIKPRASCAAAASSRLAPRCRTAVLPRPAVATTGTAPMHVSRQHPMQQLQQGTSKSRPAPSRFVPARCSDIGSGGPASGSSGPEGEARSGRDLPQPAGDANAAQGGGSSPKQPADADVGFADPKASRPQQAAEVMLPLLQEALRPLVVGQADMRAALKASQQQQLDLVKGLVEQQLQQHQEQQRQHQEQQQQQLAAFQRQEELLRQLLATASTTSGVPCQTVAGPAAIQVPPEHIVRQAPKLLDYVRVNSREDGIVLGTANRGARVKVRRLNDYYGDIVYEDDAVEVLAECGLLSGSARVQYLPYDPERRGVPVTRFTAAPGMLVRRGYDVREGEEREAAAGEVGVLQPSPDMGDTCLVEWASGSQRVYETGWGDRFELVHLETSRTSGAPVMGSDWTDIKVRQNALLWEGGELKRPAFLSVSRVVGGTAVERGTHWTYRGAEPGVGSIFAAASGRRAVARPGMVPVQWPNGQLLHHHASPAFGCDLCYSARPGDPVTLFTAREGLGVATTDGVLGMLVRPERIRGHAVLWQVKLFRPPPNTVTYAVESSRSAPSSAPADRGSPDVAELRFR